MKIGRIPYVNCYPVYGAIDRGIAIEHHGLELGDGDASAFVHVAAP